MARPEKNDEDKHSSWLKFRVTETERNLIRERADMSGKSVSDFVRTLALSGKIEIRESQADFELIQALNRIGVNINQISKRYNASGHLRHQSLDIMLSRLDEYLDRLQDT
jgi:uncharacterized protein (DUF1778 family)